MLLVVGLGNPGTRYALTRHNIGFMVVDRLAVRARKSWRLQEDSLSEVTTIELAGFEVVLAKPWTYMNNSGVATRALQQRLGIEPGEILIALDDFLLDFGCLRFRRKGSGKPYRRFRRKGGGKGYGGKKGKGKGKGKPGAWPRRPKGPRRRYKSKAYQALPAFVKKKGFGKGKGKGRFSKDGSDSVSSWSPYGPGKGKGNN